MNPEKNPHYMLDLRSKSFGYLSGWLDRDGLFLIACFTILKDFVEQEKPFKYHFRKDGKKPKRDANLDAASYKALVEQQKVGKEIWDLYVWWTVERPKEHKRHDAELTKLYDCRKKGSACDKEPTDRCRWSKYFREEQRLDKHDQEMLHRLVNIRECLWT